MRKILQAILANCKINENGCWEWQGRRDRGGYGHIGSQLAHRVTWEIVNGPIPEGLVIDHVTCDNPPCCRPDHLRVCTPVENILRGNSPQAQNARKTECARGHAYDLPNTYRHKRRRNCRICNLLAVRAYKARQKANAA